MLWCTFYQRGGSTHLGCTFPTYFPRTILKHFLKNLKNQFDHSMSFVWNFRQKEKFAAEGEQEKLQQNLYFKILPLRLQEKDGWFWRRCFADHIFPHISAYFHLFSHISAYFHIFPHISTYFHIFPHICKRRVVGYGAGVLLTTSLLFTFCPHSFSAFLQDFLQMVFLEICLKTFFSIITFLPQPPQKIWT